MIKMVQMLVPLWNFFLLNSENQILSNVASMALDSINVHDQSKLAVMLTSWNLDTLQTMVRKLHCC